MSSGLDGQTETFPGANPHPVLRVDRDGRLLYANPASAPAAAIAAMTATAPRRMSPFM